MDSSDWLALATIAAGVLGVVAAYVGTRRQRRQIKDLHDRLGNGFASEVIASLGEITSRLDGQSVQVGLLKVRLDEHIDAHASASV